MPADGISGIGKWQKEYRKNENPQERQVYRLFFFFSYIMGKKVKNSKYTNTVYTLTLVVMKEGVSRDYIYKLIIQNKYRQTRGD